VQRITARWARLTDQRQLSKSDDCRIAGLHVAAHVTFGVSNTGNRTADRNSDVGEVVVITRPGASISSISRNPDSDVASRRRCSFLELRCEAHENWIAYRARNGLAIECLIGNSAIVRD
jgi:hypothetical protein